MKQKLICLFLLLILENSTLNHTSSLVKNSIRTIDFSIDKLLSTDIVTSLKDEYCEFMKLIDIKKLSFSSVECGKSQIFIRDCNTYQIIYKKKNCEFSCIIVSLILFNYTINIF